MSRAPKVQPDVVQVRRSTMTLAISALEELRAHKFPLAVQEQVATRLTGREQRAILHLEHLLAAVGMAPPPEFKP